MNDIVVTTPERLAAMLKDAVHEAVGQALRDLAKKTPAYMTEAQAAEYLGLSHITLRQWRMEKKGPKYHKFDKAVRYSRTDIDEWMQSRIQLTIDSPEVRLGKSC